MTRQTIRLFPLALLTLAFGMAHAQAKPNFTGTWKVNVAKSDFGAMPAPDSRTDKITHEDPDLKLHVAQSGQMGDMTYDAVYTTDGKESTNSINGNVFKSTVKWDGDDLSVDTKGSFNGMDVTIKDRWTLSEDGKTITVQRHLASASMGETDQKVVFEKQ
jgi:ABC-type transport system substrate-binding protein